MLVITMVIGGARSGKSRWAMEAARQRSERPVYVATSRRWDDDHGRRIERHRRDRGPEWTTVEEPMALGSLPLEGRVVVVDCVTLWLANLLTDEAQEVDTVLGLAVHELGRLAARPAEWFLVTNELGMGVHGATPLSRKFVDLQGFVNQRLAGIADHVVWMVAGLAVSLKGDPARW